MLLHSSLNATTLPKGWTLHSVLHSFIHWVTQWAHTVGARRWRVNRVEPRLSLGLESTDQLSSPSLLKRTQLLNCQVHTKLNTTSPHVRLFQWSHTTPYLPMCEHFQIAQVTPCAQNIKWRASDSLLVEWHLPATSYERKALTNRIMQERKWTAVSALLI